MTADRGSVMIEDGLMGRILQQYALPWDGVHGLDHWARVLENGLKLAEKTGADIEVVELFAVFHDSCRLTEGMDRGHGSRAATFGESLCGTGFNLEKEQLVLLDYACLHHTSPRTKADITVQTCWDADRLDLGRVGKVIDTRYLCTTVAKEPEMMRWADQRARDFHVPAIVHSWELECEGLRGAGSV